MESTKGPIYQMVEEEMESYNDIDVTGFLKCTILPKIQELESSSLGQKEIGERNGLVKFIEETLADDSILYCQRVWSAWQHGTMTDRDFVPFHETD